MVSEIMPRCVFGLHRHARIACTPFAEKKGVVFLIFFETLFQDGRIGLPGVAKGIAALPKGAQRVLLRPLEGAPFAPKGTTSS